MTSITYRTLPDFLSGYRIAVAPALLYFAWTNRAGWVLLLFATALPTDAVDGYLARRLQRGSEFGAKLDGLGDLTLWSAFLLSAWWLWPDLVRREAIFAAVAFASYVLPAPVAFLKYKSLPSYHTWSGKIAAVLMPITVFLLVLWDIAWPFRLVAFYQAAVAVEEMAITLALPECHHDVPSILHAREILRDPRPT